MKLILLILIISTSLYAETYQEVEYKIKKLEQFLRNNAGTVEQRNYYRRKLTQLRTRLKDFSVINITKEVDMDMSEIDSAITSEYKPKLTPIPNNDKLREEIRQEEKERMMEDINKVAEENKRVRKLLKILEGLGNDTK